MKKKKCPNNCPNAKEGMCPEKKGYCPTSESFESSGSIITDNEYEITSEIEDKEKYKEKETNN